MIRFLRSVDAGRHGGLASYRAGRAAQSHDDRRGHGLPPLPGPAGRRARRRPRGRRLPAGGASRLRTSPTSTTGTTPRWPCTSCRASTGRRGTRPCGRALVETQRSTAAIAGSWDTNTVWGGYGGRVYTTAMAALVPGSLLQVPTPVRPARGRQALAACGLACTSNARSTHPVPPIAARAEQNPSPHAASISRATSIFGRHWRTAGGQTPSRRS